MQTVKNFVQAWLFSQHDPLHPAQLVTQALIRLCHTPITAIRAVLFT